MAQTGTLQYVQATQLNLRSEPGGGAVAGQLSINAPVTLQRRIDGRWCEVQAAAQRGFVDCAFLAERPLTLEQIEVDVASATLELHRLAAPPMQPQLSLGLIQPQATVLRLCERLLGLLERHFALSPSLHTYGDYQALLRTMQNAGDVDNPKPGSPPTPHLVKALANTRLPQLAAMRAALNFDGARAWPVVRHPVTSTLAVALDRRSSFSPRREARRSEAIARALGRAAGPAPKASFFRQDAWAVGWAGGPLVSRLPDRTADGVAYAITFEAAGPWMLADLLEMAKLHRVPVQAVFSMHKPPDNSSLTQATPSASGNGFEAVQLGLRLPVWAITPRGLVAGTLRSASVGADACWGEGHKVPTQVEVVFPQAVRGDIHGIFASSVPVDPARAVVTVRKRTSLGALLGEATLTHRIDMSVDIDGDGVPDLRTLVSNDQAVGASGGFSAARARQEGMRRWLRPVAGWYANNVYSLEVNEEGWWRQLSVYNVVTCT